MFANSYQSGFVSIFYSVGSNPLAIWDKQVKNGHIRRIIDDEVKSLVLEVAGTNVATTFITCPANPKMSLGIKLPFLVMIIKNVKKYFSFEIQIKDDKDMHRRFRVSNFQSTTKVYPFCTTMPIGLSAGWNQVQFNLADFTKRAYGSTYLETTRVQIHANVRIRRIYFSDMLYSEEEMPNEFRLYKPVPASKKPSADEVKEKAKEAAEAPEVPPPPSPVETAASPHVEEVEPQPASDEYAAEDLPTEDEMSPAEDYYEGGEEAGETEEMPPAETTAEVTSHEEVPAEAEAGDEADLSIVQEDEAVSEHMEETHPAEETHEETEATAEEPATAAEPPAEEEAPAEPPTPAEEVSQEVEAEPPAEEPAEAPPAD